MNIRLIVYKSVFSGTVASLAMMPVGFAFRAAGLRVGHYGPKFASLFIENPGPRELFIQHIILGWVSALPLVAFFVCRQGPSSPLLMGAAYGAMYYFLVNSLVLPLYFGDPLPWILGIETVVPSLVTHIVFGLVISYFCRNLVGSRNAA